MDLSPYVEALRRDLQATAEVAGEDAREVADRLINALDASVRLVLIDALGAAAEQITAELAPGSVELRLRGREPEFVVAVASPTDIPTPPAPPAPPPPAFDGDDGTTARISLRLPDGLKVRIEEAANNIGFSVNSWLVRALNDAVAQFNEDINNPHRTREQRRDIRPGRSLSGWAR
jgi:hypothetical protein